MAWEKEKRRTKSACHFQVGLLKQNIFLLTYIGALAKRKVNAPTPRYHSHVIISVRPYATAAAECFYARSLVKSCREMYGAAHFSRLVPKCLFYAMDDPLTLSPVSLCLSLLLSVSLSISFPPYISRTLSLSSCIDVRREDGKLEQGHGWSVNISPFIITTLRNKGLDLFLKVYNRLCGTL